MYNDKHFVNFYIKSIKCDYTNIISQNVIFNVCGQSHLLKHFHPKISKNQNLNIFQDLKFLKFFEN